MNQNNTENVIWSGRPKQGLMTASRDIYMIPFSILWCGFAIFWTVSATANGAPTFFTLWGIMFVCIGTYFIFGRFFHDSIIRSKTQYFVSDKRIKIIKNESETSIPIGQWSCLKMEKFNDGTGTIKFAESGIPLPNDNDMGVWVQSLDKTPQFYRISDPDYVLDLLSNFNNR